MRDFKLPTEVVELPSKGVLYPEDSPLRSGKIEINYPTAREEDILSNTNYINDGSVLNRFYQSIVATDNVDVDDLFVGDKNALMIAARILGSGKKYKFMYEGKKQEVDLGEIEDKEVDFSLFEDGKNEFEFHLPHIKTDITFKLLNSRDEDNIRKEINNLKKEGVKEVGEVTTRFKYIITSVDGDRERKNIRKFVDNYLISQDLKELRKYINKITPDLNLTFFPSGTDISRTIPFGIDFIWGND